MNTPQREWGVIVKKLLATAIITGALMSSSGLAMADTIQGVALYEKGAWSVTWRDVRPVCNVDDLYDNALDPVAIIDDTEVTLNFEGALSSSGMFYNYISFYPSSAGDLTKLTLRGKSSFKCGEHTFLLPGYVAPASVPTLSEWAMIMLGALLAGGAALTLYRRRMV